jgi:hypothetical protein
MAFLSKAWADVCRRTRHRGGINTSPPSPLPGHGPAILQFRHHRPRYTGRRQRLEERLTAFTLFYRYEVVRLELPHQFAGFVSLHASCSARFDRDHETEPDLEHAHYDRVARKIITPNVERGSTVLLCNRLTYTAGLLASLMQVHLCFSLWHIEGR